MAEDATYITDILGKGPDVKRPVHPDMDRVMEISLELLATKEDSEGKPIKDFFAVWREQIERTINFDVLAYKAMQVAFDVYGIRTGADFMALKMSRLRYDGFVAAMQTFYDGFLLGVRFQERGGKR